MLLQSIIGYFAAFCTSISFLPQVILIIKTKNTSAISLPMYFIYISGIILWLIYGFLINDKVVIIANIFTLFLASIVLFFKLKNDFFTSHK
jgi:MtN3 and saliva related transmembrane protein